MFLQDDYKTFHVGINIFVIKNGKLLLGKRKNVFGDGTWGLPGGHLEPGETMVGAAKRELLEETGLIAKNMIFSNLTNGYSRKEHYLQVAFTANEAHGEVRLTEPDKCEELNWFNLTELPDNLFPPHIKQIENFLNNTHFIDD